MQGQASRLMLAWPSCYGPLQCYLGLKGVSGHGLALRYILCSRKFPFQQPGVIWGRLKGHHVLEEANKGWLRQVLKLQAVRRGLCWMRDVNGNVRVMEESWRHATLLLRHWEICSAYVHTVENQWKGPLLNMRVPTSLGLCCQPAKRSRGVLD